MTHRSLQKSKMMLGSDVPEFLSLSPPATQLRSIKPLMVEHKKITHNCYSILHLKVSTQSENTNHRITSKIYLSMYIYIYLYLFVNRHVRYWFSSSHWLRMAKSFSNGLCEQCKVCILPTIISTADIPWLHLFDLCPKPSSVKPSLTVFFHTVDSEFSHPDAHELHPCSSWTGICVEGDLSQWSFDPLQLMYWFTH